MEQVSPYTIAALSKKVSGVRATEFAGFGVSLSMDQWKALERRVKVFDGCVMLCQVKVL